MLDAITPLVLTYDEAPNIARTLARLAWAREIVVVDSFSTDGTVEIVAAHANARLVQRKFDCHANQWNFGLKECGIHTEWVLALDADYIVPDALVREVNALTPGADVAGYQAAFRYCVEGQALRGTAYTPVTVLFRRARAEYTQDGHTQRVRLEGRVLHLSSPIDHDDRKSLRRWLLAQSYYMQLEAEKLSGSRFAELALQDKVRRLILIAPEVMFLYCLFVQGNILDGRAGLFYALQRAVAEAILSLHLMHRALLKR